MGRLRGLGQGIGLLCLAGWLVLIITSLVRHGGSTLLSRMTAFASVTLPAGLALVTTLSLMFGMDRLLEALNRAKDEAPVQILKEVGKSVDDFACGASQFDDLTMLCVHYIGKTDTEEGTK